MRRRLTGNSHMLSSSKPNWESKGSFSYRYNTTLQTEVARSCWKARRPATKRCRKGRHKNKSYMDLHGLTWTNSWKSPWWVCGSSTAASLLSLFWLRVVVMCARCLNFCSWFLQYWSNLDSKSATESTLTTHSGRSFQLFTSLEPVTLHTFDERSGHTSLPV